MHIRRYYTPTYVQYLVREVKDDGRIFTAFISTAFPMFILYFINDEYRKIYEFFKKLYFHFYQFATYSSNRWSVFFRNKTLSTTLCMNIILTEFSKYIIFNYSKWFYRKCILRIPTSLLLIKITHPVLQLSHCCKYF